MAHSHQKKGDLMKKYGRLSRKEFEKVFGIKPRPTLTKRQREKCMQINALFDEVSHLYGVHEKALFESAYPGDPETVQKVLSTFLNDVRTCPQEVIEHLQKLLHDEK
ncbi:hypothetical protein JXR01_02795 [Candidatus Kaiserbacteria bacterium]|nr:MAG: hypothetical protein JXR01_02795 [Candidatus Kaiserbacteria bacterium]